MSLTRTELISSALAAVQARIRAARDAAGRTDEIELVVVTKTFPASDVAILAGLGVTDIGENRDQEARRKRAELSVIEGVGRAPRWHMLGHLQRNKVASVARWADVVDSVDRLDLVPPLAAAARSAGRCLESLVQVSLDPVERTGRGGVDPARAVDLAAAVAAEPALALRGVMGVAPFPGDPDEAFARLAVVAAAIRDRWPGADRISAGMSGDLEQAVAHGATQVRVGGAILGQRTSVQ